MRRVLVPLDGSELAESILPDAGRLAGPDGQLILIRSLCRPEYDPERHGWSESFALDQVQQYLERTAEPLRADGMNVEAHGLYIRDAVLAIDQAVKWYTADMIACATHGRGPLGRLVYGTVAWKALAESTVPVLLRHPDTALEGRAYLRRIMVPLDGSSYAEQALPLAQQLAREWDASLWLVRIVPTLTIPQLPFGYVDATIYDRRKALSEAREYLDRIVNDLEDGVHSYIFSGRVSTQLVSAAVKYSITDIVMASHGRTGLPRAVLGSVADTLIQHLHLPIVVIPALAAQTENEVKEAVAAGNRF